ncbi:MAG: TSUP family transporter [Gemmatimonadales bacterium]|nr:TSUP family transporter [Gemmatimonadales bacterium]
MIAGLPMLDVAWLVIALLFAGAMTGFLAGLFGVGGGAVLVPALYELFRIVGVPDDVRMPLCVGTSLAIIIPTSIRSYYAHRATSAVDTSVLRNWAVPVVLGGISAALLTAIGMGHFYAILTISLAVFVTATILQEFVRGVGARHRLHGENVLQALVRLVGRNRRRYGGYVVHLGIVTYFVAFTGQAFKVDREASLKPGESVEVASPWGHTYTFTHIGVSQYDQLNRLVSAASVEVAKDGERIGVMSSEKRQHFTCAVPTRPCPDQMRQKSFEPSTEAGIRSDLQEDIYIVYAGSVEGTEEAVYRFTLNPLVWWLWYGGFVLVVGGVITLWPGTTIRATRQGDLQGGYAAQIVESKSA